MKRTKHIEFLERQLTSQRAWINRCGSTLQGYIDGYGDPGVLSKDGKKMFGDGGTLIYQADMDALRKWYNDLEKADPGNINLRNGMTPDPLPVAV